MFNGVCCRSIGIQCHPSTVNQSTGVSDDISIINDDELRHDRTTRILTASTRNVKSPILKRRRSQEFLSNGTKVEHPFKDDTVVVTSTCLDDDQMVRKNFVFAFCCFLFLIRSIFHRRRDYVNSVRDLILNFVKLLMNIRLI